MSTLYIQLYLHMCVRVHRHLYRYDVPCGRGRLVVRRDLNDEVRAAGRRCTGRAEYSQYPMRVLTVPRVRLRALGWVSLTSKTLLRPSASVLRVPLVSTQSTPCEYSEHPV